MKQLKILHKYKKFNTKHITGKILTIKYKYITKKQLKITRFLGLCITTKGRSKSITLRNILKGDLIELKINVTSPLLEDFYISEKTLALPPKRLAKLTYIKPQLIKEPAE